MPAIVVPYPYHKDQHQAANAQRLVALKGAVLVDDKVEPTENLQTIGPALQKLLANDAERSRMREALGKDHREDAAELIARRLLGS